MWAAISYSLLALVLIFIGWEVNSVYFAIVFYWTALSLLLVSAAYIFNAAKIFRKRDKVEALYIHTINNKPIRKPKSAPKGTSSKAPDNTGFVWPSIKK